MLAGAEARVGGAAQQNRACAARAFMRAASTPMSRADTVTVLSAAPTCLDDFSFRSLEQIYVEMSRLILPRLTLGRGTVGNG